MTDIAFDTQPQLSGETLTLRGLQAEDRDGLYAAAADPKTWAGHPASDRYKREVFDAYFDFLLQAGDVLVVADNASGRIIGCSRYYAAPDQPAAISIGFTFLDSRYWGGNTNFELKQLMLDHAFSRFSEVWFHIAPTNIRSQKATAKFGAQPVYQATLDLSGTPAAWMCFRLDRDVWQQRRAARLG